MIHAKRVLQRSAAAVLLAGLTLVPVRPCVAQAPLTRAERSGWRETSRYGDVRAFLTELAERPGSDILHPGSFGFTVEGRALPLVVVGTGLPDASPESVRGTDRLRVLVLANIHGGEVEGKEAAQMLLRSLAEGEHRPWLDSLVILVAPIYNADGNERVSVLNRWRQNGPPGGVGERSNAQGLDLNRDHMKLESPEARSLAWLLQAYDPQVVMDLHTTNGTRHAYHLTYSPPLHPATAPEIVALLRSRWLPAATRRLGAEGWRSYYYGNAYAPEGGERGWYTFDYRPRFNNNYVGLRNRIAILSEAYAYASFEERVRATLAFVEAVLDFAHAHATEIARTVAAADATDLRERRLPLRARFERGPEVEILMGEAEPRLSPYSGREHLARLDVVRPERMADYGAFTGTEGDRVPASYFVPGGLESAIRLLRFHGVRMDTIRVAAEVALERFAIDSTALADEAFQGHRQREVWGRWEPVQVGVAPGTMEVPMDQPLARLVFALLEPRSPDGVLSWNVLDEALAEDSTRYPILRRAPAGR
jgi:hypothetical protein